MESVKLLCMSLREKEIDILYPMAKSRSVSLHEVVSCEVPLVRVSVVEAQGRDLFLASSQGEGYRAWDSCDQPEQLCIQLYLALDVRWVVNSLILAKNVFLLKCIKKLGILTWQSKVQILILIVL